MDGASGRLTGPCSLRGEIRAGGVARSQGLQLQAAYVSRRRWSEPSTDRVSIGAHANTLENVPGALVLYVAPPS